METGKELFLGILLHGATCTLLRGGVLLWMRRDRDKSRIYLACVFFLSGLIFLVRRWDNQPSVGYSDSHALMSGCVAVLPHLAMGNSTAYSEHKKV